MKWEKDLVIAVPLILSQDQGAADQRILSRWIPETYGMKFPVSRGAAEEKGESEGVQESFRMISTDGVGSDDPLTRRHALFLLGSTGDPVHVGTIIPLLRDSEKAVRSQAALALAQMGEAVIPEVIPLLRDPDWKVRYRAAEILGLIGSKKAGEALADTLSDEKDHVRYMAAKSLGLIKDPAALGSLRISLTDPNQYVRRVAAEAIRAVESKERVA